MRIFISAGEPSGDLHGANLVRTLKKLEPGIEVCGLGGPRMAAEGCDLLCDLTQLCGDVDHAGRGPSASDVDGLPQGLRGIGKRAAGRRRPDRLPRLQLVDRPQGPALRNSRVLLWSASDLGLGRLADS